MDEKKIELNPKKIKIIKFSLFFGFLLLFTVGYLHQEYRIFGKKHTDNLTYIDSYSETNRTRTKSNSTRSHTNYYILFSNDKGEDVLLETTHETYKLFLQEVENTEMVVNQRGNFVVDYKIKGGSK